MPVHLCSYHSFLYSASSGLLCMLKPLATGEVAQRWIKCCFCQMAFNSVVREWAKSLINVVLFLAIVSQYRAAMIPLCRLPEGLPDLRGEWLMLGSDSGSIGHCFPGNNVVSSELVQWSHSLLTFIPACPARITHDLSLPLSLAFSGVFSPSLAAECIYRKRLSVDGRQIYLELYDPCSQVSLRTDVTVITVVSLKGSGTVVQSETAHPPVPLIIIWFNRSFY